MRFIFLMASLLGFSTSAHALVSPSSLKTKIYKFALSESELCTNPVTVFSEAAPSESEFGSLPTLGSGSISPGTYKCVVMEISDTFKYVPASTDGTCTAGTEFSKSVCGDGSPIRLIDSTSDTTCTDAEDKMSVYISTLSTLDGTDATWDAANCDSEGVDCNGSLPPTADIRTRGTKLPSEIVISEATTGTFVIDLTNALESMDGGCSFENVTFAFR